MPATDEDLFRAIRERYDGDWRTMQSVEGPVGAEVLRDGAVLVELSGRLAEYLFASIPRADEAIVYIPGTRIAHWLNYFDRVGASIRCGQWSFDMKKDLFPAFKCRFVVDSAGRLEAFTDRSAATSCASPPYYDGAWETNTCDFHWRPLSETSSVARGGLEWTVESSFGLRIEAGTACEMIHAVLGAGERAAVRGQQITCEAERCSVSFDAKGLAHALRE